MNQTPRLYDAVVSDGVKYRIKFLNPHAAGLVEACPGWKYGLVTMLADPGRLTWDKVAGLWRGPVVPAEPA